MIRIAFPEAGTAPVGGYQYSTFDVIDNLTDTYPGQVKVFYATQRDTPAGQAAARRGLRAEVVHLGTDGFANWRRPWWVLRYMWRVWRFLRNERIALLQGSNETLLLWLLPCWLAGTRPIWNVRAEMPGTFRGRLRQWLHFLLCRHVICNSEANLRSLKRNGLPDRVHTAIVRNFVSRPLAARALAAGRHESGTREAGQSSRQVTVSFVGRMDDPVKQVDRALRLAIRTAREVPSAGFLFWGHCSTTTQAALEAQIPPDLKSRIRFCGEQRDISAIYEQTDVLLLTSTTEGSPRVIMEAGAYGVPTVATAVGGVPELIVPGSTGLLFESDDEAAAHLHRLITCHADRTAFGARAQQHFLETFSQDNAMQQYFDFYCECLNRAPQENKADARHPREPVGCPDA